MITSLAQRTSKAMAMYKEQMRTGSHSALKLQSSKVNALSRISNR